MNTKNTSGTVNDSVDKTGPIVGIDLGTTNSVVAGLVDGEVMVLGDDDDLILPSVVGFDAQGKLVTGVVAQNQLIAFPDRTIASVKRKMGSEEKIQLGEQSFTPQEISAMILRRLADRAARKLGQSIARAVITVPAFFNENQRQATREAGLLAGLKVERIINEPTAATLVYHAGTDEKKHVVVYDFGGGTFDVSVVRFELGVVEVLSSKGDTMLGGDDLDLLLVDHVADKFVSEHGIDLRQQMQARHRLQQACEAAKRSLSQLASVDIIEEFIATVDERPLNLNLSISRDQFEQMIKPLIDQTIDSVTAALRDANLSLRDIDDLVLVGGSTRIPMVERRLTEEFGLSPSRAVDPDLAVALGAATQAAMLDGNSVGPVLVDITGHTLGVEVLQDFDGFVPKTVFSPIIRRNTPLPATFEEVYFRFHEEQREVQIHVLQGESEDLSRNRSVGRVTLELETGEGISNDIIVRFDLTLDGTLTVTATQQATGRSEELVIDNALSAFVEGGRRGAVERLTSLFDSSTELLGATALPAPGQKSLGNESAEEHTDQENGSANAEQFPEAVALLAKCQSKCQSVENLAADDAADLQIASDELRRAIAMGNATKVSMLCEELEDILFYIEG